MPIVPFIPAIIGAGAAIYSSNRAEDAAHSEAANVDQLEREKFLEAQRQADLLRERGDEAAAVAEEEAVRAEVGAERFETLSNEYAASATEFAERNEQLARELYERIDTATGERQEAGQRGARAIRGAARDVTSAAERAGGLQRDAFGNIQTRFSPFMVSEQTALGQLGTEMGLTEGERFTGYRDSPAYEAAQEASRVAEQEGREQIIQDAANTGSAYSGRRGAALVDRSQRGSYERAGIEASYYQNYMSILQSMANPQATGAVSDFEAQTARDIGQNYMSAAGTALNAEGRAAGLEVDTMRTGAEGAELRNMLQTGTEGSDFALGGLDTGTAGSPYRMTAAEIPFDAQAMAGGMITGNMPTGTTGANYRMEGVEAQNAATADIMGGGATMYSSYLNRPQTPPPAGSFGTNYNPTSGYWNAPPMYAG